MIFRVLASLSLFVFSTATAQDHDNSNTIIHELVNTVNELREDMGRLRNTIDQQQLEIESLKSQYGGVNTFNGASQGSSNPASIFTQFGCYSDPITLSCANNRTINITNADFGKYTYACANGCCAPHPVDDCREAVEENSPQDWVAMQVACNNKTTCTFENTGTSLDECEEGYPADYLQVYYNCLQEDTMAPVGFTFSSIEDQQVAENQPILFDRKRTDLGGHYEPTTGTFHCPYHGVYLFSVNLQSQPGQEVSAFIAKDGLEFARAFGDDLVVDNANSHGSAVTIMECGPGEVVWVKAYGENAYVNNGAVSHFSGYLLYRY